MTTNSVTLIPQVIAPNVIIGDVLVLVVIVLF